MSWWRASLCCVLASGACACSDLGQNYAELPLFVGGSGLEQPLVAEGGLELRIERAELAFGPLYLCAGAQAGELCDTARLEWLGSVRVDLTTSEARRAGTLSGTTGRVRSWMYDLGISSQLIRGEPFVLDAARELGGASLVVQGRASRDGQSIPFSAEVVLQQGSEVERGVPVVRKGSTDSFNHDVKGDERGLWVRFDAAPWLRAVDLSAELEACVASRGCALPVRLDPEGKAYRGLHNAVASGRRPEFAWAPPAPTSN
jgi:hypothetical protein